MKYKVRRIFGYTEDGKAVEAKRSEFVNWPCSLDIGGEYYLRTGMLYRIVEPVSDVRE